MVVKVLSSLSEGHLLIKSHYQTRVSYNYAFLVILFEFKHLTEVCVIPLLQGKGAFLHFRYCGIDKGIFSMEMPYRVNVRMRGKVVCTSLKFNSGNLVTEEKRKLPAH